MEERSSPFVPPTFVRKMTVSELTFAAITEVISQNRYFNNGENENSINFTEINLT